MNNISNRLRALQASLIVFLALITAGCDLVAGIFKAGLWVGIILIVIVAALVGAVTWFLRRRI